MVLAARAWAFLVEKRIPILRRLGLLETSGLIQTNLYTVRFERIPIAIDGRYGAIAPLGNGVLFSARSGRLWFVDSTRTPRELALRVPINIAEFESDPYNETVVDGDHFAVKGLLTQVTENGVRILASHLQWDRSNHCNTLRVSVIELPLDSLLRGSGGTWRTLFDTRPCLELGLLGGGRRTPTIGAGGRLVRLTDEEVLLSVGVFINDALTTGNPAATKSDENDYGKTIAIDRASGRSRVFTKGHRNPQGLAVGADQRIWSTEHAARGGDELNQIKQGSDYGFPNVSYGTEYGSLDWPPSSDPGRHEGFEKPAFAWVPSIGTSQLVVVNGKAFSRWRGDLLVSSLVGRSLFRVRLEGDRVVLVEPIQTIHRMRDIIETANGELVILAEDGFLVYLEPLDAGVSDPRMSAAERGMVVASQCQGCHSFERGGANGIGPNLFGIMGRRAASSGGYGYSGGMRAFGERWTEDALRRYLTEPATLVPGTSMVLASKLTEGQIADLIAYLESHR